MIRKYRKIWTISERGRTGVITTNTRKELYAIEATKYVQQESLHFWEKMVVCNPFSADSSKEEARVLEEFKKQLYSFKRIIVHAQRGFSLPKIVYSGKANGAADDIIMAMLITIYWSVEFTMQRVQSARKYFFCLTFISKLATTNNK